MVELASEEPEDDECMQATSLTSACKLLLSSCYGAPSRPLSLSQHNFLGRGLKCKSSSRRGSKLRGPGQRQERQGLGEETPEESTSVPVCLDACKSAEQLQGKALHTYKNRGHIYQNEDTYMYSSMGALQIGLGRESE